MTSAKLKQDDVSNTRLKLLVFVTLLFFISFQYADAQSWKEYYGTRFYNSGNSAIGQFANCAVTDEKGFLWIGTESGILRFDGKNFKSFESFGAIGQSFISDVKYDENGKRLIVATMENGIYFFDGSNSPVPASKDSTLKWLRVMNVFYKNGALFATAVDGTYAVEENKIRKFDLFDGKSSYLITYSNGYYYVSGVTGIVKTDFKNYTKKVFSGDNVKSIMAINDHSDIIWFTTYSSIYKMVKDSAFKMMELNTKTDAEVAAVLTADKQGNVYAGATQLYRISDSKGIERILDNQSFGVGITYRDMFIDSYSNIWLCTSAGLAKVFLKPGYTNPAFRLPAHSSFFNWESSKKRLLYYDNRKGVCSMSNEGSSKTVTGMSADKLKSIPWVNSFYLDEENSAYLLTEMGFYISRKDQLKVVKFLGGDMTFTNWLKTKNNEMLIGSRYGMAKIVNDSLLPLQLSDDKCQTLVIKMVEDPYHHVWAGATNGLHFYDGSKVYNANSKAGINEASIFCISQYKNVLAIALPKEGIRLYETNSDGGLKLIKIISSEHGIINNNPNDLFFDEAGYLHLLYAGAGISVVHPGGYNQVVNISSKTFPGLRFEDFSGAFVYQGNNLVLSFFDEHVLRIHTPGLFQSISSNIDVSLFDVKLFTQKVNWKEKGFKLAFDNMPDRLTLKHKENFLTFDYTGIFIGETDRILYRYQLFGADGDWVNAGELTSATYNNLLPGNYTFLVSATMNGSTWSDPLKYQFTILPPWWQTWWFRVLLFSGTAFLITFIILIRVKEFKQREMLKRVALENEMKALRSQINPHFIQNTFQIISNRIQQYSPGQIIPFLRKTSDYFRAVLLNSETNQTTLEDELAFTEKYIAFQQELLPGLQFHLDVAEEVDAFGITVPSMLLQPFVENAIKYGFSGITYVPVLNITARLTDTHVVLSIKDNGKGVNLETLKVNQTSKGNKITTQRLSLFYKDKKQGCKIDFKSAVGEGFEVMLQLPIN